MSQVLQEIQVDSRPCGRSCGLGGALYLVYSSCNWPGSGGKNFTARRSNAFFGPMKRNILNFTNKVYPTMFWDLSTLWWEKNVVITHYTKPEQPDCCKEKAQGIISSSEDLTFYWNFIVTYPLLFTKKERGAALLPVMTPHVAWGHHWLMKLWHLPFSPICHYKACR